jgi:hypothetical protein
MNNKLERIWEKVIRTNRGNILAFTSRDSAKLWKPVMVVSVPAEIQTQHFLNTSLECYSYINPSVGLYGWGSFSFNLRWTPMPDCGVNHSMNQLLGTDSPILHPAKACWKDFWWSNFQSNHRQHLTTGGDLEEAGTAQLVQWLGYRLNVPKNRAVLNTAQNLPQPNNIC